MTNQKGLGLSCTTYTCKWEIAANGGSECPCSAHHHPYPKPAPKPWGSLLPVHLQGEELAAVANLPWPGSLLPGQTPDPTSAKGSSPVDFNETWPSVNPAEQEGWESHLEGNITTKLSRLVFLRDSPLYLLPLIYFNSGHPGIPAPSSVQTACLHRHEQPCVLRGDQKGPQPYASRIPSLLARQ